MAAAVLMICSLDALAASPETLLNVQKSSNNNNILVMNIGSGPIMILGVTINDRSDCKTGTAFIGPPRSTTGVLTFVPRELKAGDKLLVYNRLGTNTHDGCKLIRAEIETDQGSETFSFFP
jgi:hypothetical protein